MAKIGITYEDFLKAYETLELEGQKLTLENLRIKAGGSPNTILKYWHQYRDEKTTLAMQSINEELSAQVKHAVLVECARKSQGIKEILQVKIKEGEQQLLEMQELHNRSEHEKEGLRAELEHTKNDAQEKILKLEKLLSAAEQKAKDAREETIKIDGRLADLLKQSQAIQTTLHKAELRATAAEARNSELEKQLEKLEQRNVK